MPRYGRICAPGGAELVDEPARLDRPDTARDVAVLREGGRPGGPPYRRPAALR